MDSGEAVVVQAVLRFTTRVSKLLLPAFYSILRHLLSACGVYGGHMPGRMWCSCSRSTDSQYKRMRLCCATRLPQFSIELGNRSFVDMDFLSFWVAFPCTRPLSFQVVSEKTAL